MRATNPERLGTESLGWKHRLKPAAPTRVHLALAALLWTGVGGALLGTGAHWARRWLAGDGSGGLLLAAALAAGLLKGHFVLAPAGRRIVARILARGDGRCLGGFLSARTWLFVGLMIAAGRALRAWVLPAEWAGLLYVWVGAGLLYASQVQWRALWRLRVGAPDRS